MNQTTSHETKEAFSIKKRMKSFSYAGRGVWLFLTVTHNAWIHFAVFVFVIALGFIFGITSIEWALILLASGLVFVTEAVNTAIEIDINLTSPEYHPYARDTKDVAAGAVLIAALVAVAVGCLVFGHYII